MLARNDIAFPDVAVPGFPMGLTRNQRAAAGAAQALGSGNPVFEAITGLTADEAPGAFDLLSGEIHAGVVHTLYANANLMREAILGRLRNGSEFGAAAPAYSAVYAADLPGGPAPVAVPVDPRAVTLWGQGFGSWGESRRTANAAAIDRSTAGFLIGADAALPGATGDAYRLGAAGGFTQTSLDVDGRLSSATIDSIHGALYGSAHFGAVRLRAGGLYAASDVDSSRQVAFRTFSDSLAADSTPRPRRPPRPATASISARWRSGRSPAAWRSSPSPGAAAIRISTDGFGEIGGAAGLAGLGRDHDIGTVTLGVRTETELGVNSPFVLRSLWGWRGAFGDVEPDALLAFRSGAQNSFVVTSVPIDRSAFVSETSLDWQITTHALLGATYASAIGEHARDHTLKGRFELRF